MQEYYFLYGLGLAWIIFAVVQDMKTTEVANWLNFSLIAFVLGYRAMYAAISNDVMFFLYGLFGVLAFTVVGYAFYYGRLFGGGDTKLLMGLGGIFPYASLSDYALFGGGFILLLFTAGVVWTLLFSAYLVSKQQRAFRKEFSLQWEKGRWWFYLGILMLLLLGIVSFSSQSLYFGLLGVFAFAFPLLVMYVRAVDKSCMTILQRPSKLIEGDWLVKDVRVGRKTIRKSVHGLSKKDIALLKKHNKRVWIKNGVQFTPAFLIAFLIMVYIIA